jgi:hypothetical protein
MLPAQNLTLDAPAISPNGSASRCEHLDGLQPVTPCRMSAGTAGTARTARRLS